MLQTHTSHFKAPQGVLNIRPKIRATTEMFIAGMTPLLSYQWLWPECRVGGWIKLSFPKVFRPGLSPDSVLPQRAAVDECRVVKWRRQLAVVHWISSSFAGSLLLLPVWMLYVVFLTWDVRLKTADWWVCAPGFSSWKALQPKICQLWTY